MKDAVEKCWFRMKKGKCCTCNKSKNSPQGIENRSIMLTIVRYFSSSRNNFPAQALFMTISDGHWVGPRQNVLGFYKIC
eukprot:scaffold2901_cov91-Skeletonema_dohrnii-CCMP3373.AAC.23